MPTQQQIASTTQKYLDIYDITNSLVILKDGTTSLIITVDAMNFGLLAEEEQDSIMYAYAGLLNSLNYPIQILIKSQTKDVTGYLNLLKEQEEAAQTNQQRLRIMRYREFVSNLIRERNVLDKKFYVAIPAKPLELGLMPVSSVIPGKSQTDISTVDKTMIIEKAKSILEPKRDHLIAQFARIGLYSRQLETQEIIQMFYQSYNPEAFEGQTMGDSKTYTAPLVSASIEEINMDNPSNPNQPAATPAQVPTTPPTQAPAQPAPVQTPTQPVTPTTPPVVEQPTPTTEPVSTPTPPAPTIEQPVAPTTPPTPPAPGVEQPASTPESNPTPTTEYKPTQMDPSSIEPPTPTQPVTPTTPPAVEQPTPTTEPVSTPTPPAPKLPETNPGEVDNKVPQEVKIEIKHPSEKEATPPTEAVPSNNQDNNSMPPLPEIK